MKKTYAKPSVKVVPIQAAQLVCASPLMAIYRDYDPESEDDEISQW